ncbi:hypothetical protein QBC44DRAFT_359546 [Cladorrhinum sp. PSN332]|nr:hypothetical protein QBC44DRAFT_359546 [Cladorrhinum sp. PSN332]
MSTSGSSSKPEPLPPRRPVTMDRTVEMVLERLKGMPPYGNLPSQPLFKPEETAEHLKALEQAIWSMASKDEKESGETPFLRDHDLYPIMVWHNVLALKNRSTQRWSAERLKGWYLEALANLDQQNLWLEYAEEAWEMLSERYEGW